MVTYKAQTSNDVIPNSGAGSAYLRPVENQMRITGDMYLLGVDTLSYDRRATPHLGSNPAIYY